MKKSTGKYNLALLVAAIIWGFAATAQKIASERLDAFTLGVIRGLLASAFLAACMPLFDRIFHTGRTFIRKWRPDFTKTEWLGGVVCGFFLSTATAFQQSAFSVGAKAGNVAFISCLYVIFVPIWSRLIFKEKPLPETWCAIPIALVGFYFLALFGTGFHLQATDAFPFGASIIFSFHIAFSGFFSKRGDPIRISCLQFLFFAIFNALFMLIFGAKPTLDAIVGTIPSLLYLGILSGGIGFTLQNLGQSGAEPGAAAFILSLESVFGVIGGVIFSQETHDLPEIVGCVIIFLAVLLSQSDSSDLRRRVFKKN